MKTTILSLLLLATLLGHPAFCGEIHDAAGSGDLEKVKALLKDNPDLIFSKDNIGGTPLHQAAFKGHTDVAELLLASKANVNAKDNNGQTPLQWVAEAGYSDMAKLLLANKADVNAKDNNGRTPLAWALHFNHEDLAELLRQHGGQE
jgi:ankyrin repeat protein